HCSFLFPAMSSEPQPIFCAGRVHVASLRTLSCLVHGRVSGNRDISYVQAPIASRPSTIIPRFPRSARHRCRNRPAWGLEEHISVSLVHRRVLRRNGWLTSFARHTRLDLSATA